MDTFEQGNLSKQKASSGKGMTKEELPRYQLIACDVASKIAGGAYPVGTKLYARSTLASQYGVSSETARRAICVLTDLGIVESTKGSGITVLSKEKAMSFIRQFRQIDSFLELRSALREGIRCCQDDLENIVSILEKMKEATIHYHTANPFVPYQIQLSEGCPHLGKNLQELNFWHLTQATVIAIGRKEKTLLSPGPFETIKADDIVYYIGKPECINRVNSLLSPEE